MIEITKFSKIIAANWKLNGTLESIESYFQYLKLENIKKGRCVIICPPSIYLQHFVINSKLFYVGAQDCSIYEEGAYTGEISPKMIKDIGCQFCIVGHSERRNIFNQKSEDIKKLLLNILKVGLNPILCIGETLEQKQKGETKKILKKQIIDSLPPNSQNNSIIIAYEPIWAIGSGLSANLNDISKIHDFLKNDIEGLHQSKILYGGSVNSKNAKEIMEIDNVDGVLIGGASLDPLEFNKIVNY